MGREPKTDGLGLEDVGLKPDRSTGYLLVDEYQKTNRDIIYVLGDVTGELRMASAAIGAGHTLSKRCSGRSLFRRENSTTITSHCTPRGWVCRNGNKISFR